MWWKRASSSQKGKLLFWKYLVDVDGSRKYKFFQRIWWHKTLSASGATNSNFFSWKKEIFYKGNEKSKKTCSVCYYFVHTIYVRIRLQTLPVAIISIFETLSTINQSSKANNPDVVELNKALVTIIRWSLDVFYHSYMRWHFILFTLKMSKYFSQGLFSP